jgi:formate dehydrogenase major subunit
MHVGTFVRGKGKFFVTEYVPTTEHTSSEYPLVLTTGRILSQYNVGAQTRRTENVVWHSEDVLEIHPHDAETRGIADGDWWVSRVASAALRAGYHRVNPAWNYDPHFRTGAAVTTRIGLATNCELR